MDPIERLLSTQKLPSPTATALRVIELAEQEDASLIEICNALSSDPALTARILRYANSPLVAPAKEITTIRQAVLILGLRAVRVTALGFSLISDRQALKCPHFKFNEFWAFAAASATAARRIISQDNTALVDEAFVAALLARVGRLAFATAIPGEYDALLKEHGGLVGATVELEQAAMQMNHVDLGAELLTRWKLPRVFADAVRHQLDPSKAPDQRARTLADAVRRSHMVADVLCGQRTEAADPALETWLKANTERVQREFRELASLLNIDIASLPDPEELKERAQEMLSELSVAAHTENRTMQVQNEALSRQAATDSLTGLANRQWFDQQLSAELARSRRYGRPLTLLMADVDRFKRVNDQYGHPAGDAVLKMVAKLMRELVRKADVAARYGGEEFVIIAPETNLDGARLLAERLRAEVEKSTTSVDGQPLRVTISIGAATYGASRMDVSEQQMIAAADRQLYRAKETGRNRCCFSVFQTQVTAPAPATAAGRS